VGSEGKSPASHVGVGLFRIYQNFLNNSDSFWLAWQPPHIQSRLIAT